MCRVMTLERDGLADLALQEYVERLAADLDLDEQCRNVYILFLISIKVCAIASLLSSSDSSGSASAWRVRLRSPALSH